MLVSRRDIEKFDQRYRVAFINSLAGQRQVVLIGTRSAAGESNLAIFNSIIHLGANPALFGIVSRPDTVQRDTLRNIVECGEYSFNYVRVADFEKAHQTSARYDKHQSEFEAAGFTEKLIEPFNVPFVQEAPVKIAMKLEERINLTINGTVLLIGSVQYVELADELVGDDGFVSLHNADILSCAGLDGYYRTDFVGRLSYAKPDTWPVKIY